METTRRSFIAGLIAAPFIRAISPASFNYNPPFIIHEAQKAFLSDEPVILYNGARGGGKTWLMHYKTEEILKNWAKTGK